MIPKVLFLRLTCLNQQELSTEVVDLWKYFGAQIHYFLSKFETNFIVIVVLRLCITHFSRCSFTKNMIRRAPIRVIHRPSDSDSRGTDPTAFIQCINGRDPQIHKLWWLGLDRICRVVHPTARAEVPARTIREFVTNYLAENGRQILIIRQLSVNWSVQFLTGSSPRRIPFLHAILLE